VKLLPNGNIEITVQLLPDTYAAMKASAERDGLREVDLVNAAICTYDHVSKMASEAGTPLGEGDEVAPC
jgi:hypothetical protein